VAYSVLGLALLGVWIHRFWLIAAATGLFRVVGLDWALYAAQALVLRSAEPQGIYSIDRVEAALQSFRAYTASPSEPLGVGPIPYPLIFALLMTPFTLPPPPLSFGLWTLLNLAAAVDLGWRVSVVLPDTGFGRAALAVLISAPIAQGLLVGQPTVLLACAMAECFLSLRGGREVRGGLWLSALLLKPQYGILLGPILIWKRRWSVVAGVALGGLVILVTSTLLVGLPGLLSYTAALGDDAPFRGGAMTNPGQMINWRGLILYLRPSIGPSTGLVLTIVLGALTVAGLLPIWRGAWTPTSPVFAAQISATLVATVLANYHSHVHGAAILAVPLAATLARAPIGRFTRLVLLLFVFAPAVLTVAIQQLGIRMLILGQPLDPLIWSPLVQVLLSLAMVGLVVDVVRRKPEGTSAATAQRCTRAATCHWSPACEQVTASIGERTFTSSVERTSTCTRVSGARSRTTDSRL